MYSVIKNQRHQKMILLIAAFAIFMDDLDSSIVNVALPVIAEISRLTSPAVPGW